MHDAGIKGKYFFLILRNGFLKKITIIVWKILVLHPERNEGTYSKYASIDDKMDGFHYYLRYIKFGLGRCMEDTAHEIRDGHLTREKKE